MSYNFPESTQSILFGNAIHGDLTITSSTYTGGPFSNGSLISDGYFNNLTISGSGQINLNGYRLFVRNILDISQATGTAITTSGNNGSNGVVPTGGSGGTVVAPKMVAGNLAGSNGGNGTTSGGGTGGSSTAFVGFGGQVGGGSASGGGNGSGGTGGNAGTANQVTPYLCNTMLFNSYYFQANLLFLIGGGNNGCGGGGGGGGGGGAGGGGGGGGAGGGITYVHANIINRSSSNVAGVIQSNGGNGGNGATATNTNTGGGGGGCGGGGGLVYIVYSKLIGTTATNAINVNGGTGGSGGNGNGTGTGGNGGAGGGAGQYCLIDITLGTVLQSGGGGAAVAANARSGITGGASKTGAQLSVNL